MVSSSFVNSAVQFSTALITHTVRLQINRSCTLISTVVLCFVTLRNCSCERSVSAPVSFNRRRACCWDATVARGNVSHSLGPGVLRRETDSDDDAHEQAQEHHGRNAGRAFAARHERVVARLRCHSSYPLRRSELTSGLG